MDQVVKAAVRRYGPEGSFWESPLIDLPLPGVTVLDPAVVPIRRWQLWNEENSFTSRDQRRPGDTRDS